MSRDFFQSFAGPGHGVDRHDPCDLAAFAPFLPFLNGSPRRRRGHGCRGSYGCRHSVNTPDSSDGQATPPEEYDDPAVVVPEEDQPHHPHPHHHHHHHRQQQQQQQPSLDLPGIIRGLVNHPLLRSYFSTIIPQAATISNSNTGDSSFTPPVDIFDTPAAVVLHVALPGAKKEDIALDWAAEAGVLRLSGVVVRPGDEDFLRSMTSGERSVGVFEREIALRNEVNGDAISAAMHDGVLVITAPKVEREWTEIRRVDIE